MLKKLKTFYKGKDKRNKQVTNQDIIDFRYFLINKYCQENIDTYTKSVYEDILIDFNNHFSLRGYNIG